MVGVLKQRHVSGNGQESHLLFVSLEANVVIIWSICFGTCCALGLCRTVERP